MLQSPSIIAISFNLIPYSRQQTLVVLTNLDASSVADVRESLKRLLCRVSTKLGDRLGHVLLAAHRLYISRFTVRIDSAEQAAWR